MNFFECKNKRYHKQLTKLGINKVLRHVRSKLLAAHVYCEFCKQEISRAIL